MSQLSLYEQVLGARYADLPPAAQRFHKLTGHTELHGWVRTGAPDSWPARLLAYGLGTPRTATSGPLRFEFESSTGIESWTRHFPTRTMTSSMRRVDDMIEERLGAARLTFKVNVVGATLRMELMKLRFLGVPCPRWLRPLVVADETGMEDRLHFVIVAALPVIGTVASYHGYLELGSGVTT